MRRVTLPGLSKSCPLVPSVGTAGLQPSTPTPTPTPNPYPDPRRYRAWGLLGCDTILCEPLRPRDAAAARGGEKFPCKRRFYDDVMRFAKVEPPSGTKGKKKKKKKSLIKLMA